MSGSISRPPEWSEEILQEIFRHTPVGVVLADIHGTIFDANQAFCEIVDCPPELIVGRPATSFLFADDVTAGKEVVGRFRSAPTTSRHRVHRLEARGGREVWVSTTISRVASASNEPICLIAFVENIDARLAVENALRESEARYRQVVESQTDLIVTTDAKGLRLFANSAYARFFGLDQRELTGTSALPLVAEQDRQAVIAALEKLSPEHPSSTFTCRMTAADGSIRSTEWTSNAAFDDNGRRTIVQSIGRDVTERVRAGDALRLSEERYRRLFEDFPGPAWESDWTDLVAEIRERGIETTPGFLQYATLHPDELALGISHIRQLGANSAALRLAAAENMEGFCTWMLTAYPPAGVPRLLRSVASVIFDGAMTARAELPMLGPKGEIREVDFHWARIRVPQSDWRIINTLTDVTERKQIERELVAGNAALRQSEQMYRDLFNRLPVAAWEIDWSAPLARWRAEGIETAEQLLSRHTVDDIVRSSGECELIVVNQRALDLVGARDRQSFAVGRWLTVRPHYVDTLARQIAAILFGERDSLILDVDGTRPDGRVMNIQLTSAANRALPGRLTNTAVDITDRKTAEEAVRNSESLYRLLFHNLPVAVWDTDWSPALERWKSEGVRSVDDAVAWLRGGNRTREELRSLRHLVEANQNALNLAGATDLDSFANWLATAIRREDMPRAVPLITAVILGTQRRANVEVRVERCDGTQIDMDLQMVAQEGRPGRVISAAIDVTEKKRIEREHLHNQMLLEHAEAIAHTGSWELDIEQDEIFGSREFWNIFDGHDGGPVRRQLSTTFESVHPEDRAGLWQLMVSAQSDFITTNVPAERVFEYRVLRPDGSLRVVRGQGVFTRSADGEIRAQGVIQDVTEQRKAEEAAQRHREELTRADRMISLGVLVSGVAHEINNPNHLIMLNTPLLRTAWSEVSPIVDRHLAESGGDARIAGLRWSEMRDEVPEMIAEIEGGAERIRAIVAELREFASDQPPGELKPLSVNDIVRGSLRLLANHLKKATKNFTLDLAEGLPPVEANGQRIEQVVVNLVLNACQALSNARAAVTVSTRFDIRSGRVEIRVADQGVGIAPDDLKKIRDPFFTTKRAQGGMGLGLAVSDRIVQEHNGTLSFESEPGRGTLAVVSLPVSARGVQNV